MKPVKCTLFLLFLMLAADHAYSQSYPVIDIHLHSYAFVPPGEKASWAGESYAKDLISPANASEHLRMVTDELKKNNIRLALVSSTSLQSLIRWKSEYPGLFMTGIQTDEKSQPILSPDSLLLHVENGEVDFLGELGLQYYGMKPDDPVMRPYYELAEQNNIPVCLHTGLGPPGGPHSFAPDFRTTLGRPSLFEPVLVRHPNLKAFIAHAGYPYISETIAMMYIYPNLYTDIGVLAWALPKKALYSTLQQLMDAGFGDRIMFGTDQMLWPGAISIAVETVNDVPFLTAKEKRDILYNNAARFLELSTEEIVKHRE